MKKGIIFILLTVFLVFASFRIVFAFSDFFLGGYFGGRIISTQATKIAELEDAGYDCYTPGTSISIRPLGSPIGTPTDYFIPTGVESQTRTTPLAGRLILGKYSGKTDIDCVNDDGTSATTVSLDTIVLFGTSGF